MTISPPCPGAPVHPRLSMIPGAALLSAALLSACGPGLAGDWEGEIECDDVTADIAVELEDAGDGEYEGELVHAIDYTSTEDGTSYRLLLEMVLDLVLETDGRGEQELDHDAELADVSCKLWEEGDLLSDDCGEMGLDYDVGASADLGELTWDGADTIEIDDGDCAGELER